MSRQVNLDQGYGNNAVNMMEHMYGRRRPPILTRFFFKQTLRVSCFPSKGFMFSLSRQLQGSHMPHLVRNQSGQQPVSNACCVSFEWQGGTSKTTSFLAPAEPPGPTPCCTMPQDRGDTTQANARRALSQFRRTVPSLLATAL